MSSNIMLFKKTVKLKAISHKKNQTKIL